MIDTYIVNLERDKHRKDYVLSVLEPYPFLSVEVIPAVEGKLLSSAEVESKFDTSMSFKRYGRDLNRGEIGCTLSHFNCYKRLLESNKQYALILEDDITILRDLNVIKELIEYLQQEIPIIIFLSGDYWYTQENKISDDYYLSSVYDAVGSYAYLINKQAAELILSQNRKASCAADNWSLYRSQGVNLKAIRPYLIDANIEDFESTINQVYFGENRRNMPIGYRIRAYWLALVKKVLVKSGHFVSKIRK